MGITPCPLSMLFCPPKPLAALGAARILCNNRFFVNIELNRKFHHQLAIF